MATHKSAEKRYRQSLKRRSRNRLAKSTLRTAIKTTLELAGANKTTETKAHARLATKLLDKAAVHGIVHKKNAQRRISRLAKAINKTAAVSATK